MAILTFLFVPMPRLVHELRSGEEYWALERDLCGALASNGKVVVVVLIYFYLFHIGTPCAIADPNYFV